MKKFGFSYFLKIINLNLKPKKTEIKRAFDPSGSGYDFHRSLRVAAKRIIAGESLKNVMESLDHIVKIPERASAKFAIEKLVKWMDENPGAILEEKHSIYESPRGIFSVKYDSDFKAFTAGRNVSVHIWNTKAPLLVPANVYAAMNLIQHSQGENEASKCDDIAVLSLRDERLFRLGEVEDHSALAIKIVTEIENLFLEVREGLKSPVRPKPGRPTAPPPF